MKVCKSPQAATMWPSSSVEALVPSKCDKVQETFHGWRMYWKASVEKISQSASRYIYLLKRQFKVFVCAFKSSLLKNLRTPKCVIMVVQFRTGQTEALLTLIVVREHSDSISPSAPLCSVNWLQRHNQYTCSGKRKKEVGNNNHFDVTRAKCPPLEAWTP